MGSAEDIKEIRMWAVDSVYSSWDGVDIFVSQDAVNWGTAVAANVSIDGDNEWVSVDIADKYGRYVKLQNIDTEAVLGELRGYEFQALITASSSSLRPPGLASLMRNLSFPDPEAVDFVIVLELKMESP